MTRSLTRSSYAKFDIDYFIELGGIINLDENFNNIINKSFFQLCLTNLIPHLILLHSSYKLHILINVTDVNPKAQSLLAHSNFLKITNAFSYNLALNASSYIFVLVATAMNL
jgi:hypothetical protein